MDIDPGDGDGEALLPQSLALTSTTLLLTHVAFEPLFDPVGCRFEVSPSQLVQNASKPRGELELAGLLSVYICNINMLVRTVKDDFEKILRQLVEGGVETKSKLFGHSGKPTPMPIGFGIARCDSSLIVGKRFVRYHQVGIELQGYSYPRTFWASSVWIVK